MAPYYAWRFWYYGQLLPNTVYAKAMGLHPRPLLEGAYYLFQSFNAVGGFFFVALPVGLALLWPQRTLATVYLALSLAGYTLFVLVSGGDWMPMQRFLVHILPLLYLFIAAGLGCLRAIEKTRWITILFVTLIAGQVVYLLALSLQQRFIVGEGAGPVLPTGKASAAYLRQHADPDDVVALYDVGLLSSNLPLETRVVDMVGFDRRPHCSPPRAIPQRTLRPGRRLRQVGRRLCAGSGAGLHPGAASRAGC